MKRTGTYKIRYQQTRGGEALSPGRESLDDSIETLLSRVVGAERRTQRLVDSLRDEILEGGESCELRIRRIFSTPREVYRIELERPELGYQRTTLLGREALEDLLELDEVRAIVENVALSA